MKTNIFTLLLSLFILSCTPQEQEKNISTPIQQPETKTTIRTDTLPSQKFWNQLSQYCGKTFEGQIIEGGKKGDGFTGERLIMHIRSCDAQQILIPFNVGDNRSRTWILKKNAQGLIQLKHDHRKEDGSDDEITMYGGRASNVGSKTVQVFPADEETRTLLPYTSGNVWWMTIDDKKFTYNLRRLGTERVFKVAFDLGAELPTPKPSWGWE